MSPIHFRSNSLLLPTELLNATSEKFLLEEEVLRFPLMVKHTVASLQNFEYILKWFFNVIKVFGARPLCQLLLEALQCEQFQSTATILIDKFLIEKESVCHLRCCCCKGHARDQRLQLPLLLDLSTIVEAPFLRYMGEHDWLFQYEFYIFCIGWMFHFLFLIYNRRGWGKIRF